MKRWLSFILCALGGLALLLCGLLVPVHLRAVDLKIIQQAGKKSRSLVEGGLTLVGQKQVGPAEQLLRIAQTEGLRGHEQLQQAVAQFGKSNPELLVWGGADFYLEKLFLNPPGSPVQPSQPFIEFVIQTDNRERLLEFLDSSSIAELRSVLQCRTLTNTTLFSPAQSAAGQPWEAALALSGLLLHEHRLKPSLHSSLTGMAAEAIRGRNPQ